MIVAWMILIVSLILSGILFWFGFSARKKWKVMKETPTRKIIDIETGRVEVIGNLVPIPGKELHGPVSGRPCVGYDVKVQEYHSSKNNSGWRTIHRERRSGPFLLKDDSGMAVVDPTGVKMDSVTSSYQKQGAFSDMNPNSKSYIESKGIRLTGPLGFLNRTLRVEEKIVPVNIFLYILGDAVEKGMPAALMNDYMVNPYTIMKKDLMVISLKDEESTRTNLISKAFIFFVLGSVTFVGGMFLAIIFWGL